MNELPVLAIEDLEGTEKARDLYHLLRGKDGSWHNTSCSFARFLGFASQTVHAAIRGELFDDQKDHIDRDAERRLGELLSEEESWLRAPAVDRIPDMVSDIVAQLLRGSPHSLKSIENDDPRFYANWSLKEGDEGRRELCYVQMAPGAIMTRSAQVPPRIPTKSIRSRFEDSDLYEPGWGCDESVAVGGSGPKFNHFTGRIQVDAEEGGPTLLAVHTNFIRPPVNPENPYAGGGNYVLSGDLVVPSF